MSMERQIYVRQASLADVPAMAQLRDASDWSGGADTERMPRYLAGEHHPQYALAARVAFVAESGGELVGYIAGHATTRFGCAGELQWLLVSPAQRGGGVADLLLAALVNWFASQNIAAVCVNVEPDNVPARRFYARHGAVDLSEYWMTWPDVTRAAPTAPPA
jgi:GNAT superfamily N-acetyltransferase